LNLLREEADVGMMLLLLLLLLLLPRQRLL
jgi:hypothetical protein